MSFLELYFLTRASVTCRSISPGRQTCANDKYISGEVFGRVSRRKDVSRLSSKLLSGFARLAAGGMPTSERQTGRCLNLPLGRGDNVEKIAGEWRKS